MILFVSRLKRNTFGFSRDVYETKREREIQKSVISVDNRFYRRPKMTLIYENRRGVPAGRGRCPKTGLTGIWRSTVKLVFVVFFLLLLLA